MQPTGDLLDFVSGLRCSDVPQAVQERCKALVRDLAAVCAAGRVTPTAVIAAQFARSQHLGLDHQQLGHALGLAEYHAPIAFIMRSVAEPAMTKDACGWGAFVGVDSALLAQRGFTAVSSMSATNASFMSDLGSHWHLADVYVKRFPCCRWSQPAVQGALNLHRMHSLDPHRSRSVDVRTFAAALELGRGQPTTREQAQYNVVWPVAVALAHGHFAVEHIIDAGLRGPLAAALRERINLVADVRADAAYPARRLSEVIVHHDDGTIVSSGITEAPGDPEDPEWSTIVGEKVARYVLWLATNTAHLDAQERSERDALGRFQWLLSDDAG